MNKHVKYHDFHGAITRLVSFISLVYVLNILINFTGISASMTAVCWNVIAYNSDDVSELGVKIFQRPASNDEYDLRAKKDPPFCKEEQNKATAW